MTYGLTPRASDFLERHWRLNRTATSAACRAVAEELAAMMPGAAVGRIKAGAVVLDWRIPEEWVVRSARLISPDGSVLFDLDIDGPVGLWAHSREFHGVISKRELAAHISTPRKWRYHGIYRPDWSGWGFSLSEAAWSAAPEGDYRVDIDAEVSADGEMAWVDATLPGRDPRPILLMAHTCHPGQVADGLGNVALLLDLYARLSAVPNRRRTWRFILGPETFTALAVLSRGLGDPPPICGLYLDMLSASAPLIWQQSFGGTSPMDKALSAVMASRARYSYRAVWGNDEKLWESQPWKVPVACLTRAWFLEYHTDRDLPPKGDALWQAGEVLSDVVEALEADGFPRMLIAGPVCRGRHGLYRDYLPREAHDAIEAAQILADGSRSTLEIAEATGADFWLLDETFRAFEAKGLAALHPHRAPALAEVRQ